MLFENIIETVGNTPLVKLANPNQDRADIYVKVESFNPSASIKDRAAKFILQDLLDKGEIGRASCRERVCQYV